MTEEALYTVDEISETLEPVGGSDILGPLDSNLISAYVELANLEIELEYTKDILRKRLVHRQADIFSQKLGEASGNEELSQLMSQVSIFDSEKEADEMLELSYRYEEASASFWYRVRLTFKSWNSYLAIRAGFTVVTLGKKYNV